MSNYKLVIESENKRITLESTSSKFEINFFSLDEDTTFVINSSNEEIYEAFRKFVLDVNKGATDLLGNARTEILIESEEVTMGYNSVSIAVSDEQVLISFSSPYNTNIVLSKMSDKEEIKSVGMLYDDLRHIDSSYYQTYLDGFFDEGREFKLTLK